MKAKNLWLKWLSEGRRVIADPDDGQTMMFVVTEIYEDAAHKLSQSDVRQAWSEDLKNQIERTQRHG